MTLTALSSSLSQKLDVTNLIYSSTELEEIYLSVINFLLLYT